VKWRPTWTPDQPAHQAARRSSRPLYFTIQHRRLFHCTGCQLVSESHTNCVEHDELGGTGTDGTLIDVGHSSSVTHSPGRAHLRSESAQMGDFDVPNALHRFRTSIILHDRTKRVEQSSRRAPTYFGGIDFQESSQHGTVLYQSYQTELFSRAYDVSLHISDV